MQAFSTAQLNGTFGAITDTHFQERDRMGRLLAFVARAGANGVGVNEGTAVLYSLSGDVVTGSGTNAKVVGASAAFFATSLGVMTSVPSSPLEATFRVRRFRSGDTFNFSDGWIAAPLSYVLTAHDGSLSSTQSDGAFY
jgi:cyanophycinase-like exopeptidase